MEDFVPTRGSQSKKFATSDYISVNYKAPKKKSKSNINQNSSDNQEKLKDDSETKLTPAELKKQQEKEMKKARYDIIKFGMSGFEKPKARKAKIELAISLGAIPPKKRRMNYKTLKKYREKEKEMEKKKEEGHVSGFTSSLLKPKTKKAFKKDSGILGIYGTVPKDALPKQRR